MKITRSLFFLFSLVLSFCFSFTALPISTTENKQDPPPNAPVKIIRDGKKITFTYGDKIIFKAEIDQGDGEFIFNTITDEKSGVINQVAKWTSRRATLKLTGHIFASEESFPCEADRKRSGPDIVRHSVGLSRSLLNRAVYDRQSDWALSVDFPSDVAIVLETGAANANTFKITITGRDIILRFRPHFYRYHRGFKFFEPWNYRVWQTPVVGWCSWFAYFQNITEKDIRHTADVLADVLEPFGLTYLQIDDGYQQNQAGLPETWLNPNEKFPSGLKSLSDYITQKGLKPGIWTYTSFHQKDFALANKKYFVLNEQGEPAYGNWVGYVMDGSNPVTLDDIIQPLYRGLRAQGWQYFKVDALRHLRFEGYNSYSQYFEKQNIDRVEVYRNLVKSIRGEIGEEKFMLGCWGIRPELMGIIDGCRIGGDGFGYAGLAQFNSFNNVIWQNDPDHIELSPQEAWRSSMVTSLTGSLFMLTDKPEVYRTELVEPAMRAMPVLFTQPGQIFDVDPTRSDALDLVDSETSGDGIRSFDADRTPRCFLYLLEINKPFESWMVLGRTGGETIPQRFEELGLQAEKEYFVFEFWSKKLLGSFSEEFYPGNIDPKFNCQLFCIRERKPHPQIIATNRHITCGGFDLETVKWKNYLLSGESKLVGNDIYSIYVTEPEGFKFQKVTCNGAEVVGTKKQGFIRIIQLKSDKNTKVQWRVQY